VLAREEFPRLTVGFLTSLTSDPNIIMLLVILFLLLVGCFVETISHDHPGADAVCYRAAYKFDPIHFALVIVVLLLIGPLPPVGILLYLTCAMTKTPINETLRYIHPLRPPMLLVVLLVAYVPWFALFVPQLFFG